MIIDRSLRVPAIGFAFLNNVCMSCDSPESAWMLGPDFPSRIIVPTHLGVFSSQWDNRNTTIYNLFCIACKFNRLLANINM